MMYLISSTSVALDASDQLHMGSIGERAEDTRSNRHHCFVQHNSVHRHTYSTVLIIHNIHIDIYRLNTFTTIPKARESGDGAEGVVGVGAGVPRSPPCNAALESGGGTLRPPRVFIILCAVGVVGGDEGSYLVGSSADVSASASSIVPRREGTGLSTTTPPRIVGVENWNWVARGACRQ